MAETLAATLTATPVGLAPDRVVDTVVAADHRPTARSHGRGSRQIRKSQLVVAASETPGITDVARCVSGGILGPLLVW